MPTTKGRPKKLKQRQIENVGKTSVLQKPKSAATETTSKVKPVKKTQKSVVKKKKRIGGKPKAN